LSKRQATFTIKERSTELVSKKRKLTFAILQRSATTAVAKRQIVFIHEGGGQ